VQFVSNSIYDTNGRTNGQTLIIEFSAFYPQNVTNGGNNFYIFPDNQLSVFKFVDPGFLSLPLNLYEASRFVPPVGSVADPKILKRGRKTIYQLRPQLSHVRTAKYIPFTRKKRFLKKYMNQ